MILKWPTNFGWPPPGQELRPQVSKPSCTLFFLISLLITPTPMPWRRSLICPLLANAYLEIYGDRVVIIPYVMPGFALSRTCAEIFPKAATQNTIGMVLLNHGIFSFGATARESYERMIELVVLAEALPPETQLLGDHISGREPKSRTSAVRDCRATKRDCFRCR